MEAFNAHSFTLTLALVGVVIVVAALLSGFIERSGVPQVAVFLALGATLGPYGLGLMNLTLDAPLLRVVATLSLALVLFTDAVGLDVREMKKHSGLAFLVLGPGTMLSAALISLLSWRLLGLSPAGAVVLGAALASTDPVLLRGLLRQPELPKAASQALRLESGLNDVVLLPVVLVAMQFMTGSPSQDPAHWGKLFVDLCLLGPGAGIFVGLIGVATLDIVRRRIGIRRDYESLYSLGIAFTAFAAAESVHGSGFLAVFAAGLTIAALDVELCDCFLDYGSSTAELALLFTFVLLGSSLIWSGLGIVTGTTLLFAILTLLIRPLAFSVSFIRARIPKKDKTIIAWFGPRGLSSLLLVLLPVFEKTAGSERLFALCCLVVLVSVLLHGGSLTFLGRSSRHAGDSAKTDVTEPVSEVQAEEPANAVFAGADRTESDLVPLSPLQAVVTTRPAASNATASLSDPSFITIEELRSLWQEGERVIVLDVRTHRTYAESDYLAKGAIRLDPERAALEARKQHLPTQAWLVAFCTCQNEATSGRVAQELRKAGWSKARALVGGWNGWQAAGLPTEAKPKQEVAAS